MRKSKLSDRKQRENKIRPFLNSDVDLNPVRLEGEGKFFYHQRLNEGYLAIKMYKSGISLGDV